MINNDFYSFSGDCYVNDFKKCVKDIKKGDTCGDKEVMCVIKMKWDGQGMCDFVGYGGDWEGKVAMCQPVCVNDNWAFAKNVFDIDMVNDVDYVYNFVLNKQHILKINDIDCMTFAHNYNNNDTVSHSFFGNRTKFINCIKHLPGYHKGLINLNPSHLKEYKNSTHLIQI
jgi:hypothetical protein